MAMSCRFSSWNTGKVSRCSGCDYFRITEVGYKVGGWSFRAPPQRSNDIVHFVTLRGIKQLPWGVVNPKDRSKRCLLYWPPNIGGDGSRIKPPPKAVWATQFWVMLTNPIHPQSGDNRMQKYHLIYSLRIWWCTSAWVYTIEFKLLILSLSC